MKINWRLPIAIAIIVIISLWTIMLLRSNTATGSAAFANPAISTVLNITLLVTAVIASGPLLYIISSARAYVKRTTSSSAPSADQALTETTAAPIIAKVKSHPLPPLWR